MITSGIKLCAKTPRSWATIFPAPVSPGKDSASTAFTFDVFLYSIAPNIQSAFEAPSKAIVESREDIKARIAGAEKA
jgi:hypothetical protein